MAEGEGALVRAAKKAWPRVKPELQFMGRAIIAAYIERISEKEAEANTPPTISPTAAPAKSGDKEQQHGQTPKPEGPNGLDQRDVLDLRGRPGQVG